MKRHLEPGQVFNGLTAVERDPPGQNMHWLFRCVCGRLTRMYKYGVMDGLNKSCGCLNGKRAARGAKAPRHGHTGERLHNIWRGILKRVDAKTGAPFQKYAARGIRVCPEWRDYAPFREWALANGYSETLTIDRIDNDRDYEPSNCRWADAKQQARNRRSSRILTVNGRTQTLAAWSEETGVSSPLIHHRIALGWTVERAVTQPVKAKA